MDIELLHADAHYDPLNGAKWDNLRDALNDAGRTREGMVANLCGLFAKSGHNPLGQQVQAAIAHRMAQVTR